MTLKAALVFNTASHQVEWGACMADGLARHGIKRAPVIEADFAVCWGWRQARNIVDTLPVLVMERGHLQPREQWTSLGWNGIGKLAEYPTIQDGGARWNRHFAGYMKPWRRLGEYALILGQVSGDLSLHGSDNRAWAQGVVNELILFGETEIVYRPHPLDGGWCPNGARLSRNGDLSEDLSRAYCAISYTSTAGVDAVLYGVSHVAGHPGSMAWPVSSHSLLDRCSRPDREPWAHRLAWTCWTADEIRSGEAWEIVKTCMER